MLRKWVNSYKKNNLFGCYQWKTWNDVKRSFENVPQIENTGDISFIYHENPIGVIYTYYDFTFFGYKLRYIKFDN